MAALKLSEISPLQPAFSAKNLPAGRTQIVDVRQIRRINCHPVEGDEDSASESLLDTNYWLNWDGDLDNPTDCEDDLTADIESDIGKVNAIEVPECPERQDVRATPNVPRLIRPTCK